MQQSLIFLLTDEFFIPILLILLGLQQLNLIIPYLLILLGLQQLNLIISL